MNPTTSGFRMNVDGFAGNKVENVDLLKKDSLFIFIEVTVDPLNSNSPMLISDSIRFNINGSIQYAYLEAIGQDVEVWMGGRIIEHDTTLVAGKPLLIYDSIYVKKDATLNIEKNVRLHFHNKAKILVDGRINAKGTLEEPIIFRADRLDNLFTLVPYDRVPGQWEGMVIDSASYDNNFEYIQFRNTVNGIRFEKSDPTIKKASFINSIIHNSTGDGIYAENCWIEAKNSLFTNATGQAVNLIGGQYEFIHCTIANYFSWRGTSGKYGLSLSNNTISEDGNINPVPFTRADFINCVITGSSRKSLTLGINTNIPSNYLFRNCAIYARGSDDDNFKETVWEDPVLKKTTTLAEGTTNKWDYLFNFELDSVSPAKNMANPAAASALPFDIRGVSRFSDDGPDIGCYEWVGTEQRSAILFTRRK